MSPVVRLNLLRPRRLGPPPSRWQPLAFALLLAVLVGAGFGAGLRWFAGIQLTEAAASSWKIANENDLRQVPEAERQALGGVVRLADELHQLQWTAPWLPISSSRVGSVLEGGGEITGLSRRRDQLVVDLRGGVEAFHLRLEEIVGWNRSERAAALRLLSYARWRLLGGTYESAAEYYDGRCDEIARRPTATPTPIATVAPTATPKRGRAPARGGTSKRR